MLVVKQDNLSKQHSYLGEGGIYLAVPIYIVQHCCLSQVPIVYTKQRLEESN